MRVLSEKEKQKRFSLKLKILHNNVGVILDELVHCMFYYKIF